MCTFGDCKECVCVKKARPHAALIKAWADGATIEEFCRINGWREVGKHGFPILWTNSATYRIKPEPKPDVMRQFYFSAAEDKWWHGAGRGGNNIKCMFDGETGKLKSVEVL